MTDHPRSTCRKRYYAAASAAFGVGADARHHRREAVRALRGQVVAKADPRENLLRIRLHDLAGGAAGIERKAGWRSARARCGRRCRRGRRAAARRPGTTLLTSHTWLAQPRTLLMSLCSAAEAPAGSCRARSRSDSGPPSRPGSRNPRRARRSCALLRSCATYST